MISKHMNDVAALRLVKHWQAEKKWCHLSNLNPPSSREQEAQVLQSRSAPNSSCHNSDELAEQGMGSQKQLKSWQR